MRDIVVIGLWGLFAGIGAIWSTWFIFRYLVQLACTP